MRRTFFVIIAASAVLIFLIAILANEHARSASITLQVAPSDSRLTLNDKAVKAETVKVKPGHYVVKATHNGFLSATRNLDALKDEDGYVGVVLGSSSTTTVNWYQTHPADARLAQIISGKNFDAKANDQAKKLPLIKSLPLIDQLYRVDYGQSRLHPGDSEAVAIYITYYSEIGKQQALDWIKFKGYDPAKLEIIYSKKIPST